MNANEQVDKTLAHQASEWVTVLRRTASPAELAAFAEWIKTSPRHVRDFLLMSTIEKELHHVDAGRQYGLHELKGNTISNVLAMNEQASVSTARQARERDWKSWSVVGMAATAAAVALVAWWRPALLGGWQTYATVTGEQRTFELTDGSIVHLNTRSRIETRMSDNARDIRLVEGEALFKVQRDPGRPFRVHSQDIAIQAVGTEFNVYRHSDSTTVAVIEGKVRISTEGSEKPAAPLGAGEEARIDLKGDVAKRASADIASAVAWRQRRLVFQATPLPEMVQEFNRYNTTPQFRLEGRPVELRHYTGVFDADDPESLVELLSAEPGLKVTRTKDEILVSTR